MIGNFLNSIKCTICLGGDLIYDPAETFEEFNNKFDLDDVDKLEDSIIEQYLVFRCMECNSKQRLNMRTIEKMVRKEISKKVITLRAKKELDKSINMKPSYLIYCGVCPGFDSKGSCPEKVYTECELKRFPNVV